MAVVLEIAVLRDVIPCHLCVDTNMLENATIRQTVWYNKASHPRIQQILKICLWCQNVWEALVSNLIPETSCPQTDFLWFFSVHPDRYPDNMSNYIMTAFFYILPNLLFNYLSISDVTYLI
jgi:hypothetical protein